MEEIPENKQRLPLKKLQAVLVQASEAKNCNEVYFLSNLDIVHPYMVQAVYCFKADENKSSKNVASVIREALGKVLVRYYPLAGTLMISDDGKFVVKCTNKGAHFVEAEADCEIDVLGDIKIPDPAVLGNLVYTFPQETSILDLPLLSIQVTRFKCGGFVLGVEISHMMVDGISWMEFMNSWAEIARGVPVTVQPYLDRRVLESRQPPVIKYSHRKYEEIEDISGIEDLYKNEKNVLQTFTFDREELSALKRSVMQSGDIKSCTNFTIITALIWRSRCKALQMKLNQRVSFVIMADGSKKADSELPKGYFGNRVTRVCCSCLAGELMEKPLSFAVEMVQESTQMATWDYTRSTVDYIQVNKNDGRTSLTAGLLVNSWARLSFHTSDFGWGEPYQTGMPKLPRKEYILFLPIGNEEGNGISVLLCLPESAMEIFKTIVQDSISYVDST